MNKITGRPPKYQPSKPDHKCCSRCSAEYPSTREYFIITKNGRAEGWCRVCRKEVEKIRDQSPKRRRQRIEQNRAMRLKALVHYSKGDPRCSCCECDVFEFLSFDHIDGGGNRHKQSQKTGPLADWLVRNNFPDGFRVLCHNCNQSLGAYGYCPHRKEQAHVEGTMDACDL